MLCFVHRHYGIYRYDVFGRMAAIPVDFLFDPLLKLGRVPVSSVLILICKNAYDVLVMTRA